MFFAKPHLCAFTVSNVYIFFQIHIHIFIAPRWGAINAHTYIFLILATHTIVEKSFYFDNDYQKDIGMRIYIFMYIKMMALGLA